uniref:hypothetical protein n=1 Tax=Acinetobacter courvalinii TaxID=280147 RepID=UPI003F576435
QTDLATRLSNFDIAKNQAAIARKTDPFNFIKKQTDLAARLSNFDIAKKLNSFDITKAQSSLSQQTSSIINNQSLGIQADLKRLLAATTLSPHLNTKILNFNQSISKISFLSGKKYQHNSQSTQDFLNTIDSFNKKYAQNLNVDKNTVQAIDLVISNEDTSSLVSELTNLGIFDTANGSIIFEYARSLSEQKASKFINILLCLIIYIYQPVIDQYEPIKNHRDQAADMLNNIVNKAVIKKDCDLKYQPDNPDVKMILPKDSLVKVYKNKTIAQGWTKIKFNKDGIDITGYVRTSEINILRDE